MKNFLTFVLLVLIKSAFAQQMIFPASGDNQRAEVTQFSGLVKTTINYSRPNVTGPEGEDRKGKIWGSLIPYGENGFPWRAGANERTTIEVSHDVLVNNNLLKAGKYGLMMFIEEREPWTIIFSKDYNGWGAFGYKKENDALRIKVSPADVPYTEWLTYGFDNSSMAGTDVWLRWENKEIRFNISIEHPADLYVNNFREALKVAPAFFYSENYQWAANFCVEHNVNLEEALKWSDRAMAPGIGVATFSTLQTKANVLNKLNRQAEADAVMDKAIVSSTATVNDLINYSKTLLKENRRDRAQKVLMIAEKNFKDEKFLISLAWADFYAAVKDKKNEKRYLKMAIGVLPEKQKSQLPLLEKRLASIGN